MFNLFRLKKYLNIGFAKKKKAYPFPLSFFFSAKKISFQNVQKKLHQFLIVNREMCSSHLKKFPIHSICT